MTVQPYSISWLGAVGQSLVADTQKGTVIGISSRGAFLKFEPNWILFLSLERFRGPLTLNLRGDASFLRQIKINSQVELRDGKIYIQPGRTVIDFSQAQIWEPLPSTIARLSSDSRKKMLASVVEIVLSQKTEPGLYQALGNLLGLKFSHLQSVETPVPQVEIPQLLNFLETDDSKAVFSAFRPLLGRGAGLTPDGDDLILGLLLAYNRWISIFRPGFDLAALNGFLVQTAFEKTTLLSANLISCATQGQADERLVQALDGLMTGSPAPQQCAQSLLGWGNSSGCNALVGMALAILSYNN